MAGGRKGGVGTMSFERRQPGAGDEVRTHDPDLGKTRSVRLSKVGSVSMNAAFRFAVQAREGLLRADAFFCFSYRFWCVQPHYPPIVRPG